jgi:transposase, IS5 family
VRADPAGFRAKTHVILANLSESNELDVMIDGLAKGTCLKVDKGFFSAANKTMLETKKLNNGLMCKAFRNRLLSQRMMQFDRLIAQT